MDGILDRLAALPVRGGVTAASYVQRLFPRTRRRQVAVAGTAVWVDFGQAKYWFLRKPGGCHEPGTTRVFRELLAAGDTVIDVGANWGYFSLLAAGLVGPSGRVLAFEPDPNAFAELQRNLAGIEQASAFRDAAGAGDGEARIASRRLRSNTGTHLAKHGLRVRLRSLDSIAAETGLARIALLKVDAEGFELGVLRGARGLLRAGRVNAVVIEVGRYSAREQSSPAAILEALVSLGYTNLSRILDQERVPLSASEFRGVDDNVLALRSANGPPVAGA